MKEGEVCPGETKSALSRPSQAVRPLNPVPSGQESGSWFLDPACSGNIRFGLEHGGEMNRLARGLNAFGMVVLGLTLTMIPLAMWVSWSLPLFLIVLAIGGTAGVLLCVLARFEDPVAPEGAPTDRERQRVWYDKLAATLADAHPMSYHHGRRRLFEKVLRRSVDSRSPDEEVPD